MKKFDEEYQIYRKEHQAKFNEDFDDWRSSRNGKDSQSAPRKDRQPQGGTKDQKTPTATKSETRSQSK